ncbi:MAG: response regulator [Verrucomicrobiota bacterium]
MTRPLQVLVVEDSEDDTLLIAQELQRAGYAARWQRVETSEAMERALRQQDWDLVIADYSLPHFSGPAAIEKVKGMGLDIPVIVVSGAIGEETAVGTMKAGASDYVMKGDLARLGPAVERELREAEQRRRRREAEAALRASGEQFRATFEEAAVGIVHAALDGRFLRVNQRMCDIVGYSQAEMLASGFEKITYPADHGNDSERLRRMLAGEIATFSEENRYVRKDRSLVWVNLTVSLARKPSGEPDYFIGVVEDITARKGAEEALELAHDALSRRAVELQDLYHTVSHELRTPLTSAREFVTILLDGLAGPLTDDQKKYLQLVLESCDQLHFCVSDMLDATRLETGKLEVRPVATSVETLVTSVVDAMTPAMQAKGIELRREIDPALSNAPLDERRINQVCMNLLSNALKYTSEGGVVTVRVCTDPHDPELIQFSVSDTGRGIAPEHLDRIFDKLYQVRETDTSIVGGVGLGLYIAREIVRLHGGRMWAESTVGRGSTFFFTAPKRVRPPRYHILFVDDEKNLQESTRAVLEHAGFEVSVAGDGVAALEMVQGQAVDLAIVDLCLPGMPGPVLIRELRNRWGDLPLVLYTGYPDSQLMTQAMEFSPLTLLIKPCPTEKLIATVRGLLKTRAASIVRKPDHDLAAAS